MSVTPSDYSLASAHAAAKARRARMAGHVRDEGITTAIELRRRRIASYEAQEAEEAAKRAERYANAMAAAHVNILAASPARIIRLAVARHFGVDVQTLIARIRTLKYTLARHAAFYFIRKYTRLSLPQIGRMFGDRDHTTVLSGCSKIERMQATDAAFAASLAELDAKVREAIGLMGEAE